MIWKFVNKMLVWTVPLLLTATVACSRPGSAAQNTPTGIPVSGGMQTPTNASPTTALSIPVTHRDMPGDPPLAFESQIQDADSSATAAQHRAAGGENYAFNLFERPFDQSMNTYFPALDIKHAALNRDATWFYVIITMVGQAAQGGLPGDYGLELDVNRDGRGDFLITAAAPKASWSTDGVRVRQDKNKDVGGPNPIQADPLPQTGDGYETRLFESGHGTDPDLAWARVSPTDPKSVQIAFKRSLFNDSNPFLWGAWAMDPSMFHPEWFDYNDHFTQAEAGSPLVGNPYYPLKALYEVDNTCRWAVGFIPTGNEPGICPVPVTPTPPPPPPSHPSRSPNPNASPTRPAPTPTEVIQ